MFFPKKFKFDDHNDVEETDVHIPELNIVDQHRTKTLDVSIKKASGYPLMGITLMAIIQRIQLYIHTTIFYIDYEYRIFPSNKPGPSDAAVAVIIYNERVSTMLLFVCCRL